jgi:D-alanyl-D-alanine carboxypeptidase (penicillin-binding protein 5/6)
MHVVHPSTYQKRPDPKPKRKLWRFAVVLVLLATVVNYARPLPPVTTSVSIQGLAAVTKPSIEWPINGQAAVGAPGYGVLLTHGKQTPLATASIAKVITVLCVLEKQPLKLNQSGPTYTVSEQDVDLYNSYTANGGSVIAVEQGEKLTEYQTLEALMIPSANNIADSLVRWVFGSQENYATYARSYLARHGLRATTIGSDASGYSPDTMSTARDLTTLGLLALKSPVLMSIAGQKSVVLPVAGRLRNYNTVLDINGINGLKTGNSDRDRGAFLMTANIYIGNKAIPITGAVLGANSLEDALQSATRLSASLEQGFQEVIIAKQGAVIGSIHTAWGVSETITTSGALRIIRWKDTALGESHTFTPSLRKGVIGSLQITAPGASAKTTLQLKQAVAGPSFWWRLTRH